MYSFHYEIKQFLPIDIYKAWQFFSLPENLALVMPPELKFKVLTPPCEQEIYQGMLINFSVKPLPGILLHWQAEISKIRKPLMFIDRQVNGPYKIWEHTHTFQNKGSGTIVTDEINYQLPLGILGKIAHAFVVKRKVENLFSYRKEALDKLFENHGNNSH